MSITLVGNGAGSHYSTGAEVLTYHSTITFPVGLATGDVAFFVLFMDGYGSSGSPGGWSSAYSGTVGNYAPPAGTNPYHVEVWKRSCTSADNGLASTWDFGSNSQNLLGTFVIVRGTDGAAPNVLASSSYYPGTGFIESYGFDARAVADADFCFFWDPLGGTFTYPGGATTSTNGFYLVGHHTALSPGGYSGSSDAVNTYPDYSFPTLNVMVTAPAAPVTAVGAATGTGAVAGVGISIVGAVGAATGTTPIAIARSGVLGQTAGTSTVAGVGIMIQSAVGDAGVASAVAVAFTGLRQSAGLAQGTSSTGPTPEDVLSNGRKASFDHVQSGLDRLCEQFKAAQVF